tara:strand:+ start:178 stop:954 length:777 start_codon:yes stop_codon:yes gene_type:complete
MDITKNTPIGDICSRYFDYNKEHIEKYEKVLYNKCEFDKVSLNFDFYNDNNGIIRLYYKNKPFLTQSPWIMCNANDHRKPELRKLYCYFSNTRDKFYKLIRKINNICLSNKISFNFKYIFLNGLKNKSSNISRLNGLSGVLEIIANFCSNEYFSGYEYVPLIDNENNMNFTYFKNYYSYESCDFGDLIEEIPEVYKTTYDRANKKVINREKLSVNTSKEIFDLCEGKKIRAIGEFRYIGGGKLKKFSLEYVIQYLEIL